MAFKLRDVTGKGLTEADLEYSSKRAKEYAWLGRYIVSVEKRRLYVVPQNLTHIEFIAQLFRKAVEDVKVDPMVYSHFVGVGIAVDNGLVTGIIIGLSGWETDMANALRKRQGKKGSVQFHTIEQLNIARGIAYDYVLRGQFKLAQNYRENVVRSV